MENIIKLTIGNWSKDNQYKSYVIITNLDLNKINDAYKIATKSLGFDYIKEVCSEYEESVPTLNQQIALLKIPEVRQMIMDDWGVDKNDLDKEGDEENILYAFSKFWYDSYLDIYLALITHGNNKFEYTFQKFEEINIGGNGLYL